MLNTANLITLQRNMARYLVGQSEADENLRALIAPEAEAILPAEARLNIYRNTVRENTTQALAEHFRSVEQLVGEDFFRAMCHAYMKQHPPEAANITLYGAHFADFIESYSHAAPLPYLRDMARYEHSFHRVFYAGDDAPLDPTIMSNYDEETLFALRFNFRESVALCHSPYPLQALWAFCHAQYDGQETDAPDMDETPRYFLLHRPMLKVESIEINAATHAFLTALMRGETLGDAAEVVMQHHADFDLSAALPILFTHALLRDVHAC